ncbi:hypothetical protein F4780DRAFT_798719 [Xylariomycetidae sp. FL0641]|nr:hypothetical protein F4780DRAFT_798719 [Xylariomycetidae sp. FL0641]
MLCSTADCNPGPRFVLPTMVWSPFNLFHWLAFTLLCSMSHASIFTRFRVELGEGHITKNGTRAYGGSCADTDADLEAIYDEAIDMARVALAAIDDYANNSTVRATMQTFFGFTPNPGDNATVSPDQSPHLTYMRGVFQKVIIDAQRTANADGYPAFYCVTDVRFRYNGKQTKAYAPRLVASLATIQDATNHTVRNADSYAWFATATYLDRYDWSRASAKHGAVVPPSTGAPHPIDSRSKRWPLSRRRQIGWELEHETDAEGSYEVYEEGSYEVYEEEPYEVYEDM